VSRWSGCERVWMVEGQVSVRVSVSVSVRDGLARAGVSVLCGCESEWRV
jgi:hypothetical protein